MSLISSTYGIDSENPLLRWFGGPGRAILGRNGRFNFMRGFTQLNTQILLPDVSWQELLLVAQNVPHLNNVICQKASMFSNAIIRHVNKKGEEVKNSPIITLLKNPNPLQNMKQWLYDYAVWNAIYNTCFCYMNYGSINLNPIPQQMWWLPSGLMKINRARSINGGLNLPYRQIDIKNIIESYQLTLDPIPFSPDEIMLLTEGISSNEIMARSRIESLQIPLSNIMAALKSANITYTDMGLRGIISSDNDKDAFGSQPGDAAEMKRIEDSLKEDYSLDREGGHITFTKSSVKFVQTQFDMQQLMIAEGLEDNFAILCGAYGLHRSVFPLSHVTPKGLSAGTEIDAGLRWTYQNTLQAELNKFLDSLSHRFGLDVIGQKLEGDYSWLPCMQGDELKEAQGEAQDAIAQQTFAQTIINLNTAIKAGNITRNGAINILTRENDMDESDAQIVIIAEPTAEEIAARNNPQPQLVNQAA